MKWTRGRRSWFALTLLFCLPSTSVFAEDLGWNSETHAVFEADLNQDGYNDLLLQAKVTGQKHYFIPGLADAKKRYDYSQRIELPQAIASIKWTADQVQLLPIKLQSKAGQSLLVFPKTAEKALLLNSLGSAADLNKVSQTFEVKQNKWLQDIQHPVYFAGDFDGDGQQDLLQLDAEKGSHQVILLEKNQKFKTAKKLSKTVQWGLKNNERLIIRDFNRDGQDDVFALSRDGKQPHVLLYSDGKGGFSQEDGKFVPVNQANLNWTDNASGITPVIRKSDKQTVLFRAYNHAERNKQNAACLGWVFDTESVTAKEYCPVVNKTNALNSLFQSSDIEPNECPGEMATSREMGISGEVSVMTACPGGIVPETPISAPRVTFGFALQGELFNVSLASTGDYNALTYQLSAQDANGNILYLGSVAAPTSLEIPKPTASIQTRINDEGLYQLMYRACNYNGCSGFGPSSTVTIQAPQVSHTVTASAGAGGTISPTSRSVPHGQTTTFTVTPNAGFTPVVNGCDGSLSGTTYTTGAITGACNVSATFTANSYTVTATAGSNGSITPPSRSVPHGQTTTFTVTPNAGFTPVVNGCGGSLSGTTYTTGAITGACNVSATFTANSYTVTATAGSNGSITPPSRSVPHGQTTTFTVTPNAGFTPVVNGCGGSLSGTTYTTGAITGACNVSATFTANSYTVTATAGSNGSITPPSRSVPHGQTTTFTVTPNAGFTPVVNGCGGSLSGTTYTTGAITGACNVSATFTANSYTVTATAGSNGSITPPSRSVPHGQTTTFTVTPNAGFTPVVNGCGGSLSGTTYTTGAITGACNVSATFTANSYTVTATAGSNGSITPPSRSVPHGQTTTFTVTPNAGYTAAASGCGGSLSGTTYTTGAITGACNVSATFTANSYTVTATAGSNGSITPPSRSVPHGQTTTFTVTPNAGYTAAASGCGGSLSGTTYTTGVITGACTVSAAFSQTPSSPDPVTLYEYDARGRMIKVNDNLSKSSTYVLDNANNRLSVSDQTAPVLAPKITSFAAPASVNNAGDSALISWTSTDTTHCAIKIFGDYSTYPNLPKNGSVNVTIYEKHRHDADLLLQLVKRIDRESDSRVERGAELSLSAQFEFSPYMLNGLKRPNMKTNLNRIIALLGAAFAMNVASATDHPHIKPLQVAADINSVDLLSGKFYPSLPTLGIPAAPRLTLETMQQFDSKITGILYAAVDAQGNSTGDRRETYSLTFGGKTSESFTCISYECKAADGTGSRLLGNMNANSRQFTYTQGSSGIKVRYTQLSSFFDNTGHAYNAKSYEGTWYASQIIYPDGEKIDIAYTTAVSGFITFHRPVTVTSNTGYQLELTYQSADINNAGWGKPAVAKLVKSTAPTVVLAQHTYSGNTITDLLGRSYTIAGFGSALGGNDYANTYSQTLPGDSSASLSVSAASLNYGGTTHNNYVTGVVRDGLSYSYTYTASTGTGYDPQKQFSKVVISGPDSYSRTVDLEVFPAPDQRQLIKSDKDSAGKITNYTYSGKKQLESVTYPEGNKEIYTYDDLGNVTHKRLVAKAGSGLSDIVTQAFYDITECSNLGTAVSLLCFRPQYTIDGTGNQTDYTFSDVHGNLLTKLEPADANGIRRLTTNTWQQVNSIWRLTETSVCGQGSCSGKNKLVTKYSYWNYTALPKTVTKTNADGITKEITTYDYDEAGRLLSEDGPLAGNADASYSRYDSVGRKTWSIGPVNQNGKRLATKTVYRSRDDQVGTVYQGYVNSETDTSVASTLLTTTNSYNSTGLLVKTEVVSDQNEKLTNISYDLRNRQSCVAVRMNPAQFASAPVDACVKGTKGDFGDDRITQHSYDVNSRLIKTISGLGTTAEGIDIEMTYTANGQVETRKDGNGNTTTYGYDGFDRLKRTSYPDGTYEENGYDANSNVTTLRKRDGTTLTHSFDNVNRLSQTTVPSEHSIVFGYDSLGRETSVTRGSQTVASTYEDLGRLQTSSTNGRTLTYGYDSAGRRNRLTYPDGFYLTYGYESDSSLSNIKENGSKTLVSYSYDGYSRLTGIFRGNNVNSVLGHTPLNQLQNFDHLAINRASFQYSPAGQPDKPGHHQRRLSNQNPATGATGLSAEQLKPIHHAWWPKFQL
ncbi:MAG: hypothetical protein U5L02_18345 [Rheinheimera sp.]|nr:hypothetical protein [Rheinheimera sp.]